MRDENMAALSDKQTCHKSVRAVLHFMCILSFLTYTEGHSKEEKWLCGDRECETVISKAKALASFPSSHPEHLSFQKNDIINVKSKSSGNRLWIGETNGHVGFFNKNFVREFKVLVQHPKHEVERTDALSASWGKEEQFEQENKNAGTDDLDKASLANSEDSASAENSMKAAVTDPERTTTTEDKYPATSTSEDVQPAARTAEDEQPATSTTEDRQPAAEESHKSEESGQIFSDLQPPSEEPFIDNNEEAFGDEELMEEEYEEYEEDEEEEEDQPQEWEPWDDEDLYYEPEPDFDTEAMNKYIKSKLSGESGSNSDTVTEDATSGDQDSQVDPVPQEKTVDQYQEIEQPHQFEDSDESRHHATSENESHYENKDEQDANKEFHQRESEQVPDYNQQNQDDDTLHIPPQAEEMVDVNEHNIGVTQDDVRVENYPPESESDSERLGEKSQLDAGSTATDSDSSYSAGTDRDATTGVPSEDNSFTSDAASDSRAAHQNKQMNDSDDEIPLYDPKADIPNQDDSAKETKSYDSENKVQEPSYTQRNVETKQDIDDINTVDSENQENLAPSTQSENMPQHEEQPKHPEYQEKHLFELKPNIHDLAADLGEKDRKDTNADDEMLKFESEPAKISETRRQSVEETTQFVNHEFPKAMHITEEVNMPSAAIPESDVMPDTPSSDTPSKGLAPNSEHVDLVHEGVQSEQNKLDRDATPPVEKSEDHLERSPEEVDVLKENTDATVDPKSPLEDPDQTYQGKTEDLQQATEPAHESYDKALVNEPSDDVPLQVPFDENTQEHEVIEKIEAASDEVENESVTQSDHDTSLNQASFNSDEAKEDYVKQDAGSEHLKDAEISEKIVEAVSETENMNNVENASTEEFDGISDSSKSVGQAELSNEDVPPTPGDGLLSDILHKSDDSSSDAKVGMEPAVPEVNLSPSVSEGSDTAHISDSVNTASTIESASDPMNSLSSSLSDTLPQSTAEISPTQVSNMEETIVEAGTTIVLDASGNVLSIMEPPESNLPPAPTEVISDLESTAVPSETFESLDIKPTATISQPTESFPQPTPPSLHSSIPEMASDSSVDYNNLNFTGSGMETMSDSPVTIDSEINAPQEAYKSVDFSSRKVLSLNGKSVQVELKSEDSNTDQGGAQYSQLPDAEPTRPSGVEGSQDETGSTASAVMDGGAMESGEGVGQGVNTEIPTSTEAPQDLAELPIPPLEREEPEGSESLSADYEAPAKHLTRQINDENLYAKEEEELYKAAPGLTKSFLLALEEQTKSVVEKLPPSLQSVLEQQPLGLSPSMTVLAFSVTIATLVMITLTSCCCSGGNKKKRQLRASVDVIQELEEKLLLAVKEKENIEDMIKDNKSESKHLTEEISKYKKEATKHQTELQTVKLHNDTLKNQVNNLQEELEDVKNSANTSQGEVKQQSKKTKDLEKQIKKLEDHNKKLESECHQLASEMSQKDEELLNLNYKISGLAEQIGQLQTSKDQLLEEAEDWKEKLSYSNERLEQREEEFKQMQESILFKENELEVLKDCFLQLKSFEEKSANNDDDDTETSNAQVQEKLQSMMDVSKVNGSLRAIEEEKNSLENKLKIEREGRKELEEQLATAQRGMETSMADKMKAERQCQEAQTKLNVLSSYFKEKEMQLQRELGEQEALKKQNQNKLMSADEATQSMQQELELARAQSESLKRELASSERDFRSQIAANEKKAHENWLAARAAERELKEARHEAGVLRQKLTDIERRQFMGPGGLIRPLPTRPPPPGVMNGPPPPPPPGMDRSPSRGSLGPRDEDYMASPRSDRSGERGGPMPPLDPRRGPPMPLPPGMRPPPRLPGPPDARSPPPHFDESRSPPPRMPPPGMLDGRSPPSGPPYDRRHPHPPPHHIMDRRSPPFRGPPPPDMLPPPPLRGGPLPPHLVGRGGSVSPPLGPDSPRFDARPDGRYPPYARPPSDRPSPRQSGQPSPRQHQSQV